MDHNGSIFTRNEPKLCPALVPTVGPPQHHQTLRSVWGKETLGESKVWPLWISDPTWSNMIQHHLTYFGVLIFVFCTHCTLQLSARVSTLVQLPSVTKVERHRISSATKAWAWHTTAWQIDFMCISAPRIRWRSTWWWSFAPVVSFLIESSIWATSLRHGSVWQKGPPVTSPLGSSHIMCGLPPGAGCDSDATDVPWLGWCDLGWPWKKSPNYKLQQAAVAVCSFFGSDVGEPNKHTSPHRTRCSLLHAPEKIVSQGRGRKHRVTMLGMWLGHETSWNHSQGVLLVVPNAATICSCTYSSCWRLPLYTDVILSYSSFWMISVRLKFNLPFHHFQQNFTNVLSWQRDLTTLHFTSCARIWSRKISCLPPKRRLKSMDLGWLKWANPTAMSFLLYSSARSWYEVIHIRRRQMFPLPRTFLKIIDFGVAYEFKPDVVRCRGVGYPFEFSACHRVYHNFSQFLIYGKLWSFFQVYHGFYLFTIYIYIYLYLQLFT